MNKAKTILAYLSQISNSIFFCYNQIYNFTYNMRAKLLQQLTPQHELLVFFSSYMRDIFNVVSNLKDIVYQLIGLHTPDPKNHHISTDIHSVLIACNTGYEDLRRVQTLLKGHLKGKIISEQIAEFVRQSRKTQVPSSNRLEKEEYKKNIQKGNISGRANLKNRQRIEDQEDEDMNTKLISESRRRQGIEEYYKQDPQIRRINASKSQDSLTSKHFCRNSQIKQNRQKSPLSLIDKIRTQLGITVNSK